MKKIISILTVLSVVLLSACSDKSEPVNAKIITPFGGPAMTQIKIMKEQPVLLEESTYEIEVVVGADPLVAAFTSKSHDIIIAPTNLGAKLYNAGGDYQLAAVIAWGANYLVSTDGPITIADLKGKEIVAFGKNATPDVVLTSILKEAGVYDDVTIRYVNSVSDVQVELLTGKATIGLLAEPILTVTKTKKELTVIDLQEEWAKISGEKLIPQAGIFVSKDLVVKNKKFVDAYLNACKEAIDFANTEGDKLAEYANDIEFGLPGAIVKKAAMGSNLKFASAIDSQASIELYFKEIIDLNPKLIGEKLPDASFYLE